MDIENKGFLSIEQLTDRYLSSGVPKTSANREENVSFKEILEQKAAGEKGDLMFSKHAALRLADRNITADPDRVLQEVAIFADRTAVTEEIVRLKSHIRQFRTFLDADQPIGRKLDFLVQEFNREANTIGSKANDFELAKTVVEVKAEIEKIREQVQNIE